MDMDITWCHLSVQVQVLSNKLRPRIIFTRIKAQTSAPHMVWWVKHMMCIGLKILQKTPTVERLNLNKTVRTAVSHSNHILSIKSLSFRRLLDNYLLLQCDTLKALTYSAKVNKKVQNWSFSCAKQIRTTERLTNGNRKEKKSLLSRP